MSDEYTTRWFKEEDLPFFLAGLNTELWEEYSKNVFKWKFQDDPFNLGFTSIITVEHIPTREPVAFNSFLPLQVRVGEVKFPCLQGCDGFVDKGHRRKGLFQRTLRFLSQEIRGKEPEVLIGFNLVNAAGAAEKAGSQITCDINRLYLSRDTPLRLTSFGRLKLEPAGVDEVSQIYEGWARISKLFHFHRTKSYLEWRIHRHPVREQHPYRCLVDNATTGYLIVDLVEESQGYTLTLNDYTPGLLENLLPDAVSALIEVHPEVVSIDLMARRKSSLHGAALTSGFRTEPLYRVIMMALNNSKQEGGSVYRGNLEVTDTEKWHFVAGDVY